MQVQALVYTGSSLKGWDIRPLLSILAVKCLIFKQGKKDYLGIMLTLR